MARKKRDPDVARRALETPFGFYHMAAECWLMGGWFGVTIGQKGRASTELRKRGITPEFAPLANCVAQIWAVAQDQNLIGWDLDEMLEITEFDYPKRLRFQPGDGDADAEEALEDPTDEEIQNPGEGWDPQP